MKDAGIQWSWTWVVLSDSVDFALKVRWGTILQICEWVQEIEAVKAVFGGFGTAYLQLSSKQSSLRAIVGSVHTRWQHT